MGNIKQPGHPKPPLWSEWEGTGNNFLDLLLVIVGLPVSFFVIVLCIIATLSAAVLTIGTFSSLLKLIAHGAPVDVLYNLLLSVVAGVFAGVATVIVRSLRKKPSDLEKSFISALFTRGLESLPHDKVFWGRVFVGGMVGTVFGLVAGASGALSFTQLLSGTAHEVLTNTSYPIYELAAKLTGGAGAGGGFDYWFFLVALFIALLLMGLLLGVLSGFAVHIIMSGIASVVKGTTKEFVIHILEEEHKNPDALYDDGIARWIASIVRGLLTGLIAGVLMAVSTVWGIVQFF